MSQKVVTFGAGQELFRQGEKGGELYFVQNGKVELSVYGESTGESAVIAIIERNSVLGTMSFMEGEARSATAKAISNVECVVIGQNQREKMLSQVPPWFKVLVKDMAASIRTLNSKYAELQNDNQVLKKKLQNLMKKQPEEKAKK